MGKIIATDLDGTLFYPKDHKNMICNANLFFIQSFIDNGGKVILVTGRSMDYAYKVIDKIGRKCSAIAYNGASILDDGQIVEERTIPNEYAKKVITECIERYDVPGVFLMTEKGLHIHLKAKTKLVRWGYKVYYSTMKVYAEKIDMTEEGYQKELESGRIFKFMLFFGLGKKNRTKASQVNKVLGNIYTELEANWSKNVIELTAKGTGKSVALLKFCEKYGYKKEDFYVVGDSGNDISMFKTFNEKSFCMGHASDNVKKYARYVLDKFEDLSRYIYEK